MKCYNLHMNRMLLNDILTGEEAIALRELKSTLKGFLGDRLVKLVLYGSKARGDYDPKSDIDIAIIIKGLTRELKNQILNMIADLEIKYLMPLSTLVISEEDFELLKKRERRIALDIEREGIPL
jgi:predicted nucleotidyltransferase